MTFGTVTPSRLLAAGSAAVMTVMLLAPSALGVATDPDLVVAAELPDGVVLNEMELGTLHFFDDEGQPFAIQAIDGCAVNDNVWLFGVWLSGLPIAVDVTDRDSNRSARLLLPAFDPVAPVGAQFEPEALRICDEESQVGGLPALDAVATFTSVNDKGSDSSAILTLLSDGAENAYRRIYLDGQSYPVITKGSPIAVVDDAAGGDTLMLLTEGRTPRQIEGVIFRGGEAMLPGEAKLQKGVNRLTSGRVRRAYEAAKGGQVPSLLLKDLGLKGVRQVHHVSLDFETLGADAYLAVARWIKEGGTLTEPPGPVEARFEVEIVSADVMRTNVPIVGPLVGSEAEGQRWEYATDRALIQIIDNCDLTGAFWTWAGVVTDEPVELVITDTTDGTSVSHLVWTDRRDVSRLADTSALTSCP